MSTNIAKKSATTKSKSSKGKNAKSSPPPLKIVVRRLRHEMTEDEFVQAVTAAAAEAGLGERGACWDILYFAPGKMSKKRGRVTSAGYLRVDRGRGVTADLRLIKLRAAVLASEAFFGPLASSKEKSGEKVDLSPVVEAAPFQKLFRSKPKRDARVGTIEKDSDYKAFCAALELPPTVPRTDEAPPENSQAEEKEATKQPNALLDYLHDRGAKRAKDGPRSHTGAAGVPANSRGNKRATSRSGSGITVGGGGAAGSASSVGDLGEGVGSGSGAAGGAASTQGSEASRATTKTRDGEKERGKSRQPRANSNSSRPPPTPAAREETAADSGESLKAALGSVSGAESAKGRSNSKSGGRAAHKSSRTGGSGSIGNGGSASAGQPSAILIKQRDKAVSVVVPTAPSSSVSEALVSPSGGGTMTGSGGAKSDPVLPPGRSGRGKGGGGGGGRGRASGNVGRPRGVASGGGS